MLSQGVPTVAGMTVEVRLTPYGEPAFEALCEVLEAWRAARGHFLAPATVVVPTGQVGVATRRALARRRLIGIDCLTLGQFSEALAGDLLAAEGRRPASEAALAGVVRQALGTSAAGMFAAVREHPSTERALQEAHRELRDLGDADLAALAGASARARDVVAISGEVSRVLARAGRHDERDLLDAATGLLCRDPFSDEEALDVDRGGSAGGSPEPCSSAPPATRRAIERTRYSTVVLYLPQRLGPSALDFLEAVAATAGGLTVVAGVSGIPEADGPIAAAVKRLAGEGAWQPPSGPSPAPTHIVALPDAEEEVRTALRGVIEGLRAGVRPEQIAILYGRSDPYERLLHDHLMAAELPYHGSSVRTLAEGALGRFLLGLLDLPARRYSRRDVMAWLSSAPIRTEMSAGGRTNWRPVPVTAWERISRRAGLLDGAEAWSERLESYCAARRLEIDRLDEENDWKRTQIERDIALAEDLQRFMAGALERIEVATRRRTWRGLAGWAQEAVADLIGRAAWRATDWPEAELFAAEQVESALERLGGLDDVDPNPDPALFRHALDVELSGITMRQSSFGQGLLVGPVRAALGVDLRRVWIVGLAEGIFPGRIIEDSLLSDADRAATRGALVPSSTQPHDDHRHYLAALSAASEERTLLFPEGDLRRTAERFPSRLLLGSARGVVTPGDPPSSPEGSTIGPRAGNGCGAVGAGGEIGIGPTARSVAPADPEGLPGGVFARLPSATAALRACGFPATRHEYDLRRMLDQADAGLPLGEHSPAVADESLCRAVAMLAGRRSRRFTRFDGNLTRCDISALTEPGRVVSASALETWAACPHAYFLRYLLGVQPVEEAERELHISALERGDLIHTILDRFFKECALAEQPLQPREAWGEDRRGRLTEIAEEVFGERERQGRVGQPIFWEPERRRIGDELLVFLDRDEERRRENGWHPWASEKCFATRSGRGHEQPQPPVEVDLGDGRTLQLRGAVDRIDTTDSGGLVVIDYKTGRFDPYAGLGEPPLLLYATGKRSVSRLDALPRLQLPIYAQAARRLAEEAGILMPEAVDAHGRRNDAVVTAGYWFITEREKFRWLQVPQTPDVEAELVRILRAIADGIAAGVFPANSFSEDGGYCDYCRGAYHGADTPALGRKLSDPALWGWLQLSAWKRLSEQTEELLARAEAGS